MQIWLGGDLPRAAQRVRTGLWTVVLLCAWSAATAAERAVLVLNDTNEPPYTTESRDGFLDLVAGEAFRRAGAELRLVKLPAERGLLNANAGVEDGDLTRIAGLEKQYPNLLRVPEKLMDWEFAAFSNNAAIVPKWPVLQRHAVGYIKGWKIYEQHLAAAERVVTADDPTQLFRLLELNRIEVALYERWLGLALARQLGLKKVQPLTPSLATREMYIYLHRRHAVVVPKLAEALRAVKREGLYARLYREKVSRYQELGQ
jgi:polar amino acid transport system substrate-binding protein